MYFTAPESALEFESVRWFRIPHSLTRRVKWMRRACSVDLQGTEFTHNSAKPIPMLKMLIRKAMKAQRTQRIVDSELVKPSQQNSTYKHHGHMLGESL
jgi:hypothetical protein